MAAAKGPKAAAVAAAAEGETRTIRDWMDPMITVSSNHATRAMLKLLHDRNDLPAMHAELRGLGLGTLQINGTNPGTGGNWQPGSIHMTSLDTARLLWLIEGGSGTLWLRPDGQPVLASLLSPGSRAFLKSLLDDQAFHEALSTGSLCGKANVRPGIPALVPARWINPDGTETAGGFPYGQDVRPCNAAAEVVFGHKTGLTFNYGSNAGIVRSLPGQPERRYVISFISSLGYRYTDPAFASRARTRATTRSAASATPSGSRPWPSSWTTPSSRRPKARAVTGRSCPSSSRGVRLSMVRPPGDLFRRGVGQRSSNGPSTTASAHAARRASCW